MSCKNCNCKDCVADRDIQSKRLDDYKSMILNDLIPMVKPLSLDWSQYITRRRFTKAEVQAACQKGIDQVGNKPRVESEPHVVSEQLSILDEVIRADRKANGELKFTVIKSREATPGKTFTINLTDRSTVEPMTNPCAEIDLGSKINPFKCNDCGWSTDSRMTYNRCTCNTKSLELLSGINDETCVCTICSQPYMKQDKECWNCNTLRIARKKQIQSFIEKKEASIKDELITLNRYPTYDELVAESTRTPVYSIGYDSPIDYIPVTTNRLPNQMPTNCATGPTGPSCGVGPKGPTGATGTNCGPSSIGPCGPLPNEVYQGTMSKEYWEQFALPSTEAIKGALKKAKELIEDNKPTDKLVDDYKCQCGRMLCSAKEVKCYWCEAPIKK